MHWPRVHAPYILKQRMLDFAFVMSMGHLTCVRMHFACVYLNCASKSAARRDYKNALFKCFEV